MNVIANAHATCCRHPCDARPHSDRSVCATRLRVAPPRPREMPTRASAMELNIPGIHGVGDSLLYFVDRFRDFSIYDVDFVFQENINKNPAAIAGLHWFGVVQTILPDRTADWLDFYRSLFGFAVLPAASTSASPKGTLLESPCHKFYLVAHRAPPGAEDIEWKSGCCASGSARPMRAPSRAARAWRRLRRSRSDPAERQGCADPDLPRRRHVRARGEPPRVRCNRKGPGGAMNIDQFGWTRPRWRVRSRRSSLPRAPRGLRRSCCRRATSRVTWTAKPRRLRRATERPRVTGFQALRDFEGLTGHLHAYKIDIARAMLSMCDALGTKVLVVCSSTSTHATSDLRRTCAISPSSPRSRCPSASGSRTARCRGRHVNDIEGWISSCVRTVPTSASPSIRITCSRTTRR